MIVDGAFTVVYTPSADGWLADAPESLGGTRQALTSALNLFSYSPTDSFSCTPSAGLNPITLQPILEPDFAHRIQIDISPNPLDLLRGEIQSAEFAATGSVRVGVEIDAALTEGGSCALDFIQFLRDLTGNDNLLKLQHSVEFAIGPLPVQLTVFLEPVYGVEVSVSSKVTDLNVAAVVDMSVEAGVAYAELAGGAAKGWLPIWSPAASGFMTVGVSEDADPTLGLSGKASAGVRAGVLLYDTAGPVMTLTGFLEDKVEAHLNDCTYAGETSYGAEATFGARLQYPVIAEVIAEVTESYDLARNVVGRTMGDLPVCELCNDIDLDGAYGLDEQLCPDGTDLCDDNGNNWTQVGCGQCVDGDLDGYGDNCDRGADCDDEDPQVNEWCPGCEDADLDEHYVYDAELCSTGDDECDDDADNWTTTGCAMCVDEDGDGYGAQCDRGADCHDADPTLTTDCPCEDLDLDGHGVFDAGLCPQGDDLCDSDPDNWSTTGCASCVDTDDDGFGAACDKGDDCDDTDGQVHEACPGTWVDPATGLMWQSPGADTNMDQPTATSYCANLGLLGHADWRLPTIDELRSIVRGCSTSESAGACQARTACSSTACDVGCAGCVEVAGPAASGCYWEPSLQGLCPKYVEWTGPPASDPREWELAVYWSTDACADSPGNFWAIDFTTALIYILWDGSPTNVRCVRTP